jgi:eukaryotic-like serine/threonine-protein kinase
VPQRRARASGADHVRSLKLDSDASGRRFGLSSILSLGLVPGSPEEVRAFQQRRLSLFVGGVCALWAFALALDTIAALIVGIPREFDSRFAIPEFWLHAGATIALGLLFLFLRSGARKSTTLNVVDAATVAVLASVFGVIVTGTPARYRPEVFMVLGCTHVLVLRATLVPSAASRSAVLAAFAFSPILLATYSAHGHSTQGGASDQPPLAYTMVVLVWSLIAVVVTSLISRILFGLHDAVRKARRLGQYTLGERIGEGGMGVVFMAEHALLRRPTAVKLLPPERAGATALLRFEREVQITSRLTHPNTVAVYDYGRTPDGVFYYAMEYLEGLNLEELVRIDGALPAGRVVHLLRQAAGSLTEAHANGLIHRDIKPSNLLLCRRGYESDFVKVLDFGLVRELESEEPSLTQAGYLAGSPLYMSPEQIVDPASVDARSDLYSLGVVAYHLLTGAPPFNGKSVMEVCGHHLHTPPEALSTTLGRPLPSALEGLILRCLAKKPTERPADARSFIELLDACEGVPTWTQADAESWWESRGKDFLDRRRNDEQRLGTALTFDVADRSVGPNLSA